MKDIRLLQTAYIRGIPRSPAEGIQTVDDAEAAHLIKEGVAEDASGDVEREEDLGDGLEARSMTEKKLRTLADKEGAAVEGDADKGTIVAAIRARRALFEGTGIDPATDDDLRKIAADEKVDVSAVVDTAALVSVIAAARVPKP